MSENGCNFENERGFYTRHWDASDGGSEYLILGISSDGIAVESAVVGGDPGKRFGLHYTLKCQPDWAVREVAVEAVGIGRLRLFSDGKGSWLDEQGFRIAELNGCFDVDISATPFTNTLPIRRLALTKSERKEIGVVYLDATSLSFIRDEQAYTCILPGKLYRYEALSRAYSTELYVDSLGVVKEYPELFRLTE